MIEKSAELSSAKRALYELRSARNRVAQLEAAPREPIAIVGLGLRFPGEAVDAASFWRVMNDGVDAITEIPPSRWSVDELFDPDPDAPGRMYTRHGGLLADVDRFDPAFFGISAREADAMDPQQRLVLEVAWEALEHAGQDPLALSGTDAGVFIAASNSDYGRLIFRNPDDIDVYSCTGTNFSVVSGRLSFFLGLCGPSLVVDTACSGSLVSVHMACQSLRSGECGLALAGGVNLILTPEINISFSRGRMMAPDGRCKTFDASADGYVRGEGCGLLVLKRLSDAQTAGDRVLAVIRGSAVNQDGRSGGLTVPNGRQQERVIREALRRSALQPSDVDYVEAHGTGTALGDPIEAHALRAALTDGRAAAAPLVVGSVKTNIGHLEAAAGVAGLIKVVLALQHEWLPQQLHFATLNPHIDWTGAPIEVAAQGRTWHRRPDRVRVAGVSSFGFSGTNAHVIVAEAPEAASLAPATESVSERPVRVLAISAASAWSLEELTNRYAEVLANQPELPLADYCASVNTGRASLRERAAYVASSDEDLRRAVAERQPFASGRVAGAADVAFLFTGQGAQFIGMGRQLYEHEPVFRSAIDQCAHLLEQYLDVPLKTLLWEESGRQYEADTRYTQPALFALQWALYRQWTHWGVAPTVLLGHSVGEYAAACAAGVFSLEDGIRLIAARARLTGNLPLDAGCMAAIVAPRRRVEAALSESGGAVTIAAYNGSDTVTIAGARDAVNRIVDQFEAEGHRVERLRVSHAFHSPMMAPIESAFEAEAAAISMSEPAALVISSVTGERITTGMAQASYWRAQVRQPVRFDLAMTTLANLKCTAFIEIGPGSTLLGLSQPNIGRAGQVWVPSLRRSRPDLEQMSESLAAVWTSGAAVDWRAFEAGRSRTAANLPAYPFERQRHWLETAPAATPHSDTWAAVVEAGNRQAQQGRLDLDVASYGRRWDVLDRLTTAFIVEALTTLGAFTKLGERHSLDGVMTSCGMAPGFSRLVGRWLPRLVGVGWLRAVADGEFERTELLQPESLSTLRAEADATFGADRIVLDYLLACGTQLASILTGRMSPLETLFPNGSFERAEALYERAPMSAYFAALGRAALEAIVRTRGNMPLRIIEVGAGTGATTSAMLPVLPAGSSYLFTDVSDAFLEQGRSRFGSNPVVHYGVFNAETGAADKSVVPGSFDVVVATNVIHALRDIDAGLTAVRSLLAPGGYLILCEVTEHLSWFDITTGLIEGWQAFEDRWRTDQPLLPAEQWTQALAAAGFAATVAWPAAQSPAQVLGQHVIVSCVPGRRQDRAPAQSAASVDSAPVADHTTSLWVAQLRAAVPDVQHDMLVDLIRREMATVLRTADPRSLDPTRRLTDLGLDSLMALQVRARLGRALALPYELPATLVFDHPTIDRMADHFATEVLALRDGEVNQPTAATESRAEAIAELTEAEAEALLLRRLRGWQTPA